MPYRCLTNILKEGLQEVKLKVSPTVEMEPAGLETTTSTKRKADEIADSEEGDELGSDDDFGLPDNDIFNSAVLDDDKNEENEENE